MWVLVVLFVHHGLLIDRPSMYVDPRRFSSFEQCKARGEEFMAAYADYREARCIDATNRK